MTITTLMTAKKHRIISLTALLIGLLFVIIPPFFFAHNPSPKAGFIGRYGIPLFRNADGTMHYMFWIDFAIAALLCWTISWINYYKLRKINAERTP